MNKKINIAIVGVGNCASSLVQGLSYYASADGVTQIPGLMHPSLAGYKISDISVVAAFDVNKTQVGATIVHRTLTNLFLDRGMPIDHTYQLNVGGNTDFQNMLERGRLKSKKISKTQSVTSQIKLHDTEIAPDDVHIGPSDYVPWL